MYSETVTKFISQGAKLYSSKDYEQAANSYADACAAFNEEHSRDDADLLLLYGKALFQNAVANSGVLGGTKAVEGSEKNTEESDDDNEDDESGFQFHEGMAEEEVDNEIDDHVTSVEENEDPSNDSDGDDGNDDDASGDEQSAPEEEQTDFEAAWDILDLTRALLEQIVEDSEKDATELKMPYLASDNAEPEVKYVESVKKLSETYDLLGEVSLETENFLQAAADLEACLKLRQKLYNKSTSSWVSESHYKLSLALEFCVEETDLRAMAASHVKQAIAIVKAQADDPNTEEAKKSENAGLLRDLEERFKELQKDPEREVEAEQLDIIKGLLGEAVASSGAPRASVETMEKSKVNDLSSMVKKRKAKPSSDLAKKSKK